MNTHDHHVVSAVPFAGISLLLAAGSVFVLTVGCPGPQQRQPGTTSEPKLQPLDPPRESGDLPPPADITPTDLPPPADVTPRGELPPPTELVYRPLPAPAQMAPAIDIAGLMAQLPPPWTEASRGPTVIVFDEFEEKAPALFEGFQGVMGVRNYRSIAVPAGRISEVAIDDRGHSWIREKLRANREPLIDQVAHWLRNGFAALAKGSEAESAVEESTALDSFAKNSDVHRLSDDDRQQIHLIAHSPAVLFVELRVQFSAIEYVGNPALRNQYLIRADYSASARLVDVERGSIPWANAVSWSRTFVLAYYH